MSTATQGWQAKVAVEPGLAPHTFDASSEPYEFNECTVRRQDNILDTDGIRGTRSHHSVNTRLGVYTVGGNLRWKPTPADLVNWLPRILGTAPSGTTFALADDLTTATGVFGLLVADGSAQAANTEFTDCMVGKATFSCAPGQLLDLNLEIAGKTEALNTAMPALTLGTTALSNSPFTLSDAAVTLVSSARDTMSVEVMIDNVLDVRFSNSRTATSITSKDRIVTFKTTHPYTTAEHALYNQAVTGSAGSLVFTNSTVSLTFTFGVLQAPSIGRAINSKGETVLEVTSVARMTGSTKELVVTLDSTP